MDRTSVNEKITLFSLFKHFFILSTFAFGGGSTIISMIRERFVDRLKWIEDEELTDMLAIAQVAPGATTINVCVVIAYQLKGIKGVIVAIVASILPPLIAIIAIQEVLSILKDNEIAKKALLGVKSAAAAIIFTVVISMISRLVQKKKTSMVLLMIIFFVADIYFKVHIVILLAVSVILGIIITFLQKKTSDGVDV
ncbi:MAG: chromate transporter [Clostridia bacterium]|nr:chromate transporter [Clostridia bacterium]